MATDSSEMKSTTIETSLSVTEFGGLKQGSLALPIVDGRYDTVSWLEKLDNVLSAKFPNLDGMIRNAEVPIEPPLDQAHDMLTPEADPYGINRQILYEEAKLRTRRIEKRKEDYRQAYAIIEAIILGTPLMAKCEREENWTTVSDARDALGLALLIERVATIGGDTSSYEKTTILREQYTNLRMRPHGLLFEHYRQYKAHVRRMKAEGIEYSQGEMTFHFIRSLDTMRFGEYQRMCADISRGVQQGAMPATLEEAYNAATAFEENYAKYRTPQPLNPTAREWAAFTSIASTNIESTESKTAKDWSALICFCCEGRGHYANECPSADRLKKP